MTTSHPGGTGVAPAVDSLRSALRGQALTPGDEGWDAARLPWNRAVSQDVLVVVTATNADDVATTVRYAREHGLAVAAQPQGHAPTSALDGTVLLRTGELDGAAVDPARRVARVGAGTAWGQVSAAVDQYGLTGLCGSSAGPSVVGYTLGGGLSWFGRAHGLAANSVLAFEVVDAEGHRRRVTADGDAELFWALRGGGGDFAVVTAMEFTLYPAPHIFGGRRMWPVERAAEVMDAYRSVVASAPDELSCWYQLLTLPPVDTVPEPLRGRSFVAVDAVHLGPAESGAALLEPVRRLGGEVMDTYGTVLPSGLTNITQEPTDPLPALDGGALLGDLDDGLASAFLEAVGPGTGSPFVIAQLRHLGGAMARQSPSHGAAGHVHEPFSAYAVGVPMTPELGEALVSGLGRLRAALAPFSSERRLFNMLGVRDGCADAFGPGVLDRLQSAKRRYDPAGVFRSNRPVLGLEPPPPVVPAPR